MLHTSKSTQDGYILQYLVSDIILLATLSG